MIVTRFAPSPTGYLHIGGARTALFNWLLAKKTGGKFILRIEDTDQKRNTPTAMQQVMDDLRWLGITWDEGPEVGGANGPYLQSERRDIYDKYMAKLLEEGKAYYCFDTSEELSAMRDEAEKNKGSLVYSRPSVFPGEADVAAAVAAGRPVTIRFAVPQDKPIVVKDIIRGEISFDPAEIGDFIIQKSDGFPTYHFAVVVDDALMGVTHILRGQEHLMNTPGHRVLQEAFGFDTPVYAHMSVTMSDNGGKLSKRERPNTLRKAIREKGVDLGELAAAGGVELEVIEQFMKKKSVPDESVIEVLADYIGVELPEINVVDFIKSGYTPEAMINFMALLGWNPGNDLEIMDLDELINVFDEKRFTKTNSFFDRKKLMSFNMEHLKRIPIERLEKLFRDYLNLHKSPVAAADCELLKRYITINAGARSFADIDKKCRFVYADDENLDYDMKAAKKNLLKGNEGVEMLRTLRDVFAGMENISVSGVEEALRKLSEEKGLGLGKIAQPLRIAICGNTVSPPIFDSVELLGKETTLKRIDISIEKFSQMIED